MVAPSFEQSAKGHSFTLNDPLYVKSFANNCYHLSGTPADCTYFGLNKICPDVDVVVSGINMGANLGYRYLLFRNCGSRTRSDF